MSKYRLNRVSNKELTETKKAVHLSIITKCPSKWLILDLETLKVFSGTENIEIGKQWSFKFEMNEEFKDILSKTLENIQLNQKFSNKVNKEIL